MVEQQRETDPRHVWLALIVLAAAAFLYRLLWLPGRYLELDAAVYLRATADYARHIHLGDWATTAVCNETYAAVEYWPPLYPLLCGLVQAACGISSWAAAVAVSWWSGWLAILPAFAIGRRLWGIREGAVAAAFVALSPSLSWYATAARSESLFLLLLLLGLAAACRGIEAGWPSALLGGAFLGLAYMTRFEGGVALLLCAASSLLLARGRPAAWRAAAALALGFALAAAPYVSWLTHLNGGRLALIPPQKAAYDSLEGTYVAVEGGSLSDFVARFGPPGLSRVDEADPATARLRAREASLLAHCPAYLARCLRAAAVNWLPVVVLLGGVTVARGTRDPRVRALAVLFPLALVQAVLSFWDPAPRYFGFTHVLWSLLAAPSAVGLWREGFPRSPLGGRLLMHGAVPVLLFASWYLPREHFEIRGSLEPFLHLTWLDAGAALGACAAALAAGMTASLLGAPGVVRGGLVLAVSFLGTLANAGRWAQTGRGEWLLPVTLVVMAGATACFFLPEASPSRTPRFLRWCAAALLMVCVQNLVAMKTVDRAYAASRLSSDVAAYLQAHREMRTVVSPNSMDVIRSGLRWIPLPPSLRDPELLARREGADAVVLLEPSGEDLSRGTSLRRVASFAADTVPWLRWNIYRTADAVRGTP